jgi:hypothetical protein
MEESISKISREYDELDSKTQKVIFWIVKRKREKIHFFHYQHKKAGGKGESKATEFMKQQEKKMQEWQSEAPAYLKVK